MKTEIKTKTTNYFLLPVVHARNGSSHKENLIEVEVEEEEVDEEVEEEENYLLTSAMVYFLLIKISF